MNVIILTYCILIAQLFLVTALFLCAMRALRGPRAQDRVAALDGMYMSAMLLLIATGMRQGTPYLFEGALIIGTLGFVSTAALGKFLLRGEAIE
ncbi:MAG: K+/H+ antiporter subunit F [Paracoccus denitrificans]|nr:MAG: K+/H+ antiporter subunit F [Paracoccus denitrificans]PZO83200.1 MAG: K+/H+ antiporter subunit F [Paracoccus denitrificans]